MFKQQAGPAYYNAGWIILPLGRYMEAQAGILQHRLDYNPAGPVSKLYIPAGPGFILSGWASRSAPLRSPGWTSVSWPAQYPGRAGAAFLHSSWARARFPASLLSGWAEALLPGGACFPASPGWAFSATPAPAGPLG
jgi:hypothetical protein